MSSDGMRKATIFMGIEKLFRTIDSFYSKDETVDSKRAEFTTLELNMASTFTANILKIFHDLEAALKYQGDLVSELVILRSASGAEKDHCNIQEAQQKMRCNVDCVIRPTMRDLKDYAEYDEYLEAMCKGAKAMLKRRTREKHDENSKQMEVWASIWYSVFEELKIHPSSRGKCIFVLEYANRFSKAINGVWASTIADQDNEAIEELIQFNDLIKSREKARAATQKKKVKSVRGRGPIENQEMANSEALTQAKIEGEEGREEGET